MNRVVRCDEKGPLAPHELRAGLLTVLLAVLAGSRQLLKRKNLFPFNATTGVIDHNFAPEPDHEVSSLVAAPGGKLLHRMDFGGGRPVPGTAKVVEIDD